MKTKQTDSLTRTQCSKKTAAQSRPSCLNPGRVPQGILGVLLAGLLLTLCGCVTEPMTGRQRLILTSQSQETALGSEAWTELQREETLSSNATRTAAVKRVGNAIRTVVDESGFEWEFKLFASEQANAFCLPGGKVGVYDGLFKHLDNDAQLAAVVAHEIAHAIARHGGERMSQAMAVGLVGMGLSAALDSQEAENRELWLAAYSGVTTVGVILPYSRVHEYEADEIGMIYMARAGYDPRAAISFWQRFGESKSGAQTPEILSTHPLDANRVKNLQSILPRAQREYEKAASQRGLGEKY